ARADRIDLEAAPLRVTSEGAVQVSCPQRGLVAADALADLDDHVLAVRGVGLHERELQLFLERHEPFLELGDELPQVAVGACVIEIGACLPPALAEAMRAFELLQLSPCV